MNGNENDSSVANEFYMKYIKPLKELKVTVIVIHHSKKPSKEDKDIKSLNNVRGSSDISAQYDTIWTIEKLGDEEDELSEDYMPSSESLVVKDFDVTVTRSKDSRVLTNVKTFTFGVHADENTRATNFKFLYYHKIKNRESMKNKVLDYILTKKQAKRIEMENYFASDFKLITLKKYLAELVAEDKISTNGVGLYSAKNISKVIDTSQTKLSDNEHGE
jgi:hypothetical protein